MSDIAPLQQAIRELHGCESVHVESTSVQETFFQGYTVWRGVVEIFRLIGHPQAEVAYAWSRKTADGQMEYVAIPAVDSITTPEDAVRAAVAARLSESP